jgi:HD-like signal output (HDOD) protein
MGTLPPDPEVSDAIWHEMRVRIGELRGRFSGRETSTDVDPLLDGIGRSGAVIRQPPIAAQAVLSLSRRRNYRLDEMTALFERDPAMSQALLRHGNSAWYAGLSDQPLLSIKAAIQRVGSRGVHATVMYHLLQGELSRPGAGLDTQARMVWEHMVRTAPLARGLARFFGGDAEEAFTLGLLHDVGKLVFFDRVAAERTRLRRELVFPDGFVTAALSLLHEPLGGLAILEWGMDQRSARIIATHHRWGDHPVGEPLSQVVYLAEAVDIARQRGDAVDLALLWQEGDLAGPTDQVAAWLEAEAADQDDAERAHRRRAALSR